MHSLRSVDWPFFLTHGCDPWMLNVYAYRRLFARFPFLSSIIPKMYLVCLVASFSHRCDGRWLKDVLLTIPTPRAHGRAINVKYITQVGVTWPPIHKLSKMYSIGLIFKWKMWRKNECVFTLWASNVCVEWEGIPYRYLVTCHQPRSHVHVFFCTSSLLPRP